MGIWYRTNTVSVSNGSPVVTGVGTGFTSLVKPGDFFFGGANNRAIEVLSVESPTQFTLAENWPFETLTDAAYAVAQGPKWGDASGLATLITQSIAAQVAVYGGTGVPADSLGVDGSVYFRSDVAQYYSKEIGVWVLKANLIGPQGPQGIPGIGSPGPANTLAIGTVATGAAGSPASATITGAAPNQTLNLTIPKGSDGGQGIQGLQGNPGPANSLSIDTVTTGAPGSNASASISGTAPAQKLNLTIPRGADGANGSILTAKSSTPITSSTGDQTFTLAANANLIVGQRVRIASLSVPRNFMSGIVKSWNAGIKEFVVTVDLIGPSPAAASDWNISITGEKGDQGPPGGFGSLVAAKGTLPVGDGTTFGAMVIGADGTVPIADSTKTYGFSWQAEDAINAGPYWTSSDVDSAATCDIGAATTPFVRITGTTPITSLGTQPNRIRFVEFTGSLTLTYNGTSLVLPGTANIITQAGDKGIFISDASGNWKCLAWTPIGFLPREKLAGNRTYYVRTDGSDSNNGLANTSAGAFATIQKAVNVAFGTLDLGGFTVTIQLGDGTYTTGTVVKSAQVGAGSIVVSGNAATPGNVIISCTSANCFWLQNYAALTVQNMELRTATIGECFLVQSGAVLNYANIRFGTCVGNHINNAGGTITATGNYSIVGNASRHVSIVGLATTNIQNRTITLTGTPAFSICFAQVDRNGLLNIDGDTFSGSATGTRYSNSLGGGIVVGGAGASYLPGSIAGATNSPAWYA